MRFLFRLCTALIGLGVLALLGGAAGFVILALLVAAAVVGSGLIAILAVIGVLLLLIF
ncbi:MAG: hypothetical protein HFH26_06725 [Clostridiaceae bacterium]|nr:hypothetical protein [Clostridiaceae bacterium]